MVPSSLGPVPIPFKDLGEEGLKILRDVGDEYQMPVVTEVTDPRCVELVDKYADMLQIGARNMQNFVLLTEVGKADKPVLLKRGMSATIADLLMSAEYILSQGNSKVVLCERGVRGFDPKVTRNLYDVAAVAAVKQLSHLPIIVDPSHATGQPALIPLVLWPEWLRVRMACTSRSTTDRKRPNRTGHRRCCPTSYAKLGHPDPAIGRIINRHERI